MDTPRPDFKSRASRLWKERIQTLNATLPDFKCAKDKNLQKSDTNHWFGRICNSTTMSISIYNAIKSIGLKILILGAAELQIRQNGVITKLVLQILGYDYNQIHS